MDALLSAACRAAPGPRASSGSAAGPAGGEPAPGAGKPQLVLLGATMPPESALEAAVHKARLRTHARVSMCYVYCCQTSWQQNDVTHV